MSVLSWLLPAVVIIGRVGVVVLAWRLLVWLVAGRNPWREPPRWLWRRRAERDAARGRAGFTGGGQ